jgi:MATE family multidrug resistance protein
MHGNIFIRTLCLMFSFAFFMAQSAQQGDILLAANAVLLHFITFMAFFLDGFANATEVLTGKAIGSRNQQQLKQGFIYTALWSGGIALLFSLNYFLWGPSVISLLTTIPDVIATANQYLIWLIIAPVVSVWSYLFDGLFIGATRSKEMRNTMLFSTLFCYLPAWYLLQDLGNHGLWLAIIIFLAARGGSQAFYLPKVLSLK